LNVTQNSVWEYFTWAHPITVSSWDTIITLLDRNLWATTNNTSSTGSYWYYFQWWNNWWFNWFDPTVAENAIESQVDASAYWPWNYYTSGIFLRTGQWTSVINRNLWWWSGDGVDSTYYWYPSINPKDRQWPCPDWFHVPSRGEWIVLFDMLKSVYNYNWDWDTYGFIKNKLYVPYAWLFWNSINYNGDNGYFWTSSPKDSDARYIQLEDWVAWLYTSRSASIGTAFPVRCFYDYYQAYIKPVYIEQIDSNTQVTVWQAEYNGLPDTMEVTINNIQQVNNKPVLWEVLVNFWSNESAKFSKLVKVNVPVEDVNRVIIKVKHVWSSEYNFDGLTLNRNASCDANWTPTSSQYNWEPITVVNWYASIYTCEASSFVALDVPPLAAKINLSVIKWTLTIWTETWNLNLWQVNVSNSAQELSWSFWANSFWVEDMKWLETGYYTTISVTDLNWTVSGHSISANNVSLKTAWSMPSDISWATVEDAKVVFWEWITSWHNGSWQVNYFQRLNTATADAWRVWKWWDNLQIKVNIPAHTPYDTYRWTITYTLYDNDL
jgi:hypothetical protein